VIGTPSWHDVAAVPSLRWRWGLQNIALHVFRCLSMNSGSEGSDLRWLKRRATSALLVFRCQLNWGASVDWNAIDDEALRYLVGPGWWRYLTGIRGRSGSLMKHFNGCGEAGRDLVGRCRLTPSNPR